MRPKKEIGMVLILLGLFFGYVLLEITQRVLAATFGNPVFLGQANLLNLTRSIGLFGIFSVAMGVVIITGGIDLSIGSMFALLGVILADLLRPDNMPWPLAISVIILIAMVLGLFHGLSGSSCAPAAVCRDALWAADVSRPRSFHFSR